MQSVLLVAAGRRRSPRNRRRLYPADPPTIEEIIRVMRCAGERAEGLRMRALIVVLWRAGPQKMPCGVPPMNG